MKLPLTLCNSTTENFKCSFYIFVVKIHEHELWFHNFLQNTVIPISLLETEISVTEKTPTGPGGKLSETFVSLDSWEYFSICVRSPCSTYNENHSIIIFWSYKYSSGYVNT